MRAGSQRWHCPGESDGAERAALRRVPHAQRLTAHVTADVETWPPFERGPTRAQAALLNPAMAADELVHSRWRSLAASRVDSELNWPPRRAFRRICRPAAPAPAPEHGGRDLRAGDREAHLHLAEDVVAGQIQLRLEGAIGREPLAHASQQRALVQLPKPERAIEFEPRLARYAERDHSG